MPPLRPVPPALLVLWLATASATAEPTRAVESFGDRTVTVVRGGASPPATAAVPPAAPAPVGVPYATPVPYPPPVVYGAPFIAGFSDGYDRGGAIVVVPDGRRRGYRLPRAGRGGAGFASPIVPQFDPGPMPTFR